MRYLIIATSLYVFFSFSSCVPRQQYTELEQTLAYYKGEALSTDSIRATNLQIQADNSQTQAEYQNLTKKLEQLTATNISLNRNYQDVVDRYNKLVSENQQLLKVSSYENSTLEQELALRQQELDDKERSLDQMQIQVKSRDAELRRLEARSVNTPTGYNNVPDARFNALRTQKANANKRSAEIRDYFQRVLVGFPLDEVNIEQTTNAIKLELSQSLLFAQGEGDIYWKGRQALQQIAIVLRDNPELKLQIVGHTNPSSNNDYDWEISVFRALAVAKDLASFGVDTANITAAGKGGNEAKVSATDARAQILNGRTELIIPLDHSEILESLD